MRYPGHRTDPPAAANPAMPIRPPAARKFPPVAPHGRARMPSGEGGTKRPPTNPRAPGDPAPTTSAVAAPTSHRHSRVSPRHAGCSSPGPPGRRRVREADARLRGSGDAPPGEEQSAGRVGGLDDPFVALKERGGTGQARRSRGRDTSETSRTARLSLESPASDEIPRGSRRKPEPGGLGRAVLPLFETNSPSSFASLTCWPLSSPTTLGLQSSPKRANLARGFALPIGRCPGL
jgi:hypothetical protein